MGFPPNYEDDEFLDKWNRVLKISKVQGSEVSPKKNDEVRKIRAKEKVDDIINTAQQKFDAWFAAGASSVDGANGYWHGTNSTGNKPTSFTGLKDSHVEGVLKEMLEAGQKP